MKFRLIILFFLGCYSSSLWAQNTIRVMSFNIRFNNPGDGENAWPKRVDLVNRLLVYHQPDIIGVQEALEGQMNDLKQILPGFDSEGIPRTEGGEYSAILYRSSMLEKMEGNTFYLSSTPEKLSTGWDAALPRIATWAKFRIRATGAEFFCINTHFDHVGRQAREESARLILRKIDSLNRSKLPVILTGDFNATPESVPIQTILSGGMSNSRFRTMKPGHGPESTWSGWTIAGEPGRTIDYIFVEGDLAVIRHGHLAESFSGRFPSDHLPVLAELFLYPIKPTPGLHSHNDYEQVRPLFDALAAGATSIEADVWLIGGILRVSHLKPLLPENFPTLEQLYLQPLSVLAAKNGGAIYPGYHKPIQLMIDVKNDGEGSLAALQEVCRPYRGLPVDFVISGNRHITGILTDPDSLFSVDGRIHELENAEQMLRTLMVSISYRDLSSWKGRGEMPVEEQTHIRQTANAAHNSGATFRVWGIPQEEKVWELLTDLGVDWLNIDDLDRGAEFLKTYNQQE